MAKELCWEDAFKYQRSILDRWKVLLKYEYYKQLEDEVKRINSIGYSTPYDVCSGSSIDRIVHRLKINDNV